MKIQLHFKTPDVLDYAMEDATLEQKEAFTELASKWVEYGECITIEIDTEEETCIVKGL